MVVKDKYRNCLKKQQHLGKKTWSAYEFSGALRYIKDSAEQDQGEVSLWYVSLGSQIIFCVLGTHHG